MTPKERITNPLQQNKKYHTDANITNIINRLVYGNRLNKHGAGNCVNITIEWNKMESKREYKR